MREDTDWGRDSYGGEGYFEQESDHDEELPDEGERGDDDVVDGDAGGREETANYDYSQFEEFEADLKMLEEYNEQNARYATRELDDARASIFLERVNVDLEAVKAKIREFLQYRHQQYNRINKMPQDRVSTWMLAEQVHERELALHHKLSLLTAGLSGEDIGNTIDDFSHLQVDAVDDDGRELRKELKEKMRFLSREEREDFLLQVLESGGIDENQYTYLRSEFI